MVMVNPFTAAPPYWVMRKLAQRTRKGKDFWDPFHKLLNTTGVYQLILKRTPWYYTGIICSSTVLTWGWTRICDRAFLWWNQGYVYRDNPYVAPPPEEEDAEEEEEEEEKGEEEEKVEEEEEEEEEEEKNVEVVEDVEQVENVGQEEDVEDVEEDLSDESSEDQKEEGESEENEEDT